MPRYIVILTVIKDAYGASHSTIAGIAKRFVMKAWKLPSAEKSRKTAAVK